MKKLLASAIVILIFLGSCEKAKENRDTSITEDHAQANAVWDDVNKQCENSADYADSATTYPYSNNCATLTIDGTPGVFPLDVTVDFGDLDCIGIDGRARRGKLHYHITGRYRQEGTVVTITPEDYFVNDYGVEGSRTITNKGRNGDGFIQFNAVTESTITTPENETIKWNADMTRTWVEGEETGFLTRDSAGSFMGLAGITDDVYELTGSADGVSRAERAFTVTITAALRLELSCKWIVSGVLEQQPEGLKLRTIDYGDGTCDNDATVTVGKRTYDIKLRR